MLTLIPINKCLAFIANPFVDIPLYMYLKWKKDLQYTLEHVHYELCSLIPEGIEVLLSKWKPSEVILLFGDQLAHTDLILASMILLAVSCQ